MRKARVKAQSAMEYLMTYGWAILVIAVVFGALFAIGIFGTGNLGGTSCREQPGYLCSNPSLAPNGLLTFTYGQTAGFVENDTWLTCSTTQAVNGGPNPNTYGVPGWQGFTGNTLLSGSQVTVSIYCSNGAGTDVFNGVIGESYTGTIWADYNDIGQGTPSIIVPVAQLTVKVS